jgi:hypothetical protein
MEFGMLDDGHRPALQYSSTPIFHSALDMETEQQQPNFLALAQEILKFRKEKHPHGYNYAVRLRMGHAEIHDLTAIADIVSAIQELGYQIVRKTE